MKLARHVQWPCACLRRAFFVDLKGKNMFSTMNLKRLHLLRSSIFAGLILLLAGVAQASELPDFTEIVRNSAAAVVKISTSSKPVAKVPDMQGNQEIPEMFRRFSIKDHSNRGAARVWALGFSSLRMVTC